MRGSIQKKGSVFYAVIPLNGKRLWFRGGKKKDAERILDDKVPEIRKGTYRELPEITFKDFSIHWLKTYAEMSVKPSTYAGYKHIIEKALVPVFGTSQLSEVTNGDLQTYVTDRKNKVSAKTVCNDIVVVKEMFKHAHRWGYVRENPAEHVERPRVIRPDIEILAPEEIKKVIEKVNKHYRVAFLTAFLTGMRAGELWGLQWGDIDWNSKQLYVRRSLWKGTFQTPKSKSSVRKIDIPESLIYELKKWKLACPVSDDDLVFPSPEGKMSLHDNAVKRYFNPALRGAGLRAVSFHSLRHSNASMRIQAGQNIKYISSQLGHASINITLDIYGHLFNDVNFTRSQVDLLARSFDSVRNPLEGTQNLATAEAVNG